MSKTTVLVFNGGSIGEGASSENTHNLQLGVMSVNSSEMYVLLDKSMPIESAPGYAPVDRYALAEWIQQGDVVQMDCANISPDTDASYTGTLLSTTNDVNPQGIAYTDGCTIRLDIKLDEQIESRFYDLETVHDELLDVWYLAQDVNGYSHVLYGSTGGKLHRIAPRSVLAGDPSPKPRTDWIVDLESPNPKEPDGYDRLTVAKAIEIHANGEIFVYSSFSPEAVASGCDNYFETLFTSSSGYVHMILVKTGHHQSPNEVSLATIDNYGDYLGISDAFQNSEYWNVSLVQEGGNILNHNKIHRLRPALDLVIRETSNYGGWVLDLESPNENAPGGYDRLTPQRLKQILDNGEFLVMETYTHGTYVPLALQALVEVQNENPLRIRVDFVRQYAYGNLLELERMAIYTPSGEESYLQILGIGPNSSWWQNKEALAVNGDGSDVTAAFTEAQTRTNISTGEKLSVLFGKIKKWFTDLKALAFKDKADLTQDVSGILPIANGGTNASTASDARTNLDVYSKSEVNTAIDTAVASAYHAAGTKTVAQLTNALLIATNQGNVYNITDSGSTTEDFVDGAGHPIVAGDNVGVCDIGGGVYKFDLLSGFVDLSGYLAKTGDGSNITAMFTAASSRTNITTGEKLSVIFGKIAKWFGDLKALAFKDTISDSDISGTISDEHIASARDWDAKADTNKVVAIADATVSRYNYGGGSSWYKVAECNLKRTAHDANTSFDVYFSRGSWRSYGQLNVCVRNQNPLRIRLNELYMESTEPNFGFKLVTRGTNSTSTAVAEIWAYCNENEGGVALIERNGAAGAYATDSKSIWTYTSYGTNDSGTEAPVEDPSSYVAVSDTDVIIRLSSKGGDGSDVTSSFTKASGDTSTIVSGGKLSAIFTAISSFFSTIASHIANRSNPHNVTAAQTGAEPAFSILPANKGGTGKDTVNSAANNFIYNLQLTSSDIASDDCEIITGDANHTPTNLLTFYKRPVSALWSYIKNKIIGSIVNVSQSNTNIDTSSFVFVNGHIYHLTMYLQGSPLIINTTSSGTGYAVAYIGSSISQAHYSCRQFVEIQNGELTTDDIRLPIDWKAENIEGSDDNQLHVIVVFNGTKYSLVNSTYELTLMGTDFSRA